MLEKSTEIEHYHPSFTHQKEKVMGKMSIFKEFVDFMMVRKKWWLAPLVIVFLLLGFIIVATEKSAVAPFIYTLF